ncbi:MAG: hypothetical protein ACRERV_11645, partial [Methylococcales bacterium]
MTKIIQYRRTIGFILTLCIAFAVIWISLGTEPDLGSSPESNPQGRSEAQVSDRAYPVIDPESAKDPTIKKEEEG